jgi:opacity protein-like surface antigen
MRPSVTLAIVICALLFASAQSAAADVTAFIGVTPTPENHGVRGFALGAGLLVIAFEFEYSNAGEDLLDGLPSLQTGSGNLLIQTPVEVYGMQFYGTTGGGVYRERLDIRQETHFSTNLGGGAKIRLVGPLRVRLDYRVFRLHGEPLNDTYQRFYAGVNLAF